MEAIFKALSDPTRRALLDSLRKRAGQTLTDLEEGLQMTRFGVMKHLKILEAAGLVVTRKSGRFKHHYLNAVPLAEVSARWIEPMIQGPTADMMVALKTKLEGNDMKPDYVSQTYIKTTPDALWEALTTSEITQKYHFMGVSVDGAFEAGQTATYVTPDGMKLIAFEVLSADPPNGLEMMFHPQWMPDLAKSRVTYAIEQVGDLCKFTVEHFDIPAGQEGAVEGWSRLIAGLKSYLETGERLEFPPMQ